MSRFLILLLLTAPAIGQPLSDIATRTLDDVNLPFNVATVRASWTPPCVGSGEDCGSPAVEYVLQLRYNADSDTTDWFNYASAISDTFINVDIPLFVEVQARVAGVDTLGRQGVWSEPGPWFVADFGPPGPPLDPRWVDSAAPAVGKLVPHGK